jgi:DNA repair photolyase
MGLRESKGNMYKFVTHTKNFIKGECEHNCAYCYMKKWGNLKPIRFDEKELKEDIGSGKFIFVGSSNDIFANTVSEKWINKILNYLDSFDNQYLFQTKNPSRLYEFIHFPVFARSVICTTIESNRVYHEFMGNTPTPSERADDMNEISFLGMETYVTIEPIMSFDLKEMVDIIYNCTPIQVNIGANTMTNINLPEPSKKDIFELINELNTFTTVVVKDNLKRLIG